jgi:hypothetical protein
MLPTASHATVRWTVRVLTLAGAVAALHLVASSHATDDSLFEEPALEVVLYDRPQESYRFPRYNSLDVLTQRNDNNRSGTSHWPGLNQHSIQHFQKIGEIPVDSQEVVTAQPLYARSVLVNNVRQDVVIIATSTNTVYAVTPHPPFTRLWAPVRLGEALSTDPTQKPLPDCDIAPNAAFSQAPAPEGQRKMGYVGIEATPVVDVANNRVLVGYKTSDFQQRLAAIDLNNGLFSSVLVTPPMGEEKDRFKQQDWARLHRNRASLLLADGVVYLAFSSLCEGSQPLMHGSILAFDARTLDRVGEFEVSAPYADGGGIWQGGSGPAADTDGNIYFVTGNRRLPGPCLVGIQDLLPPDTATLSNSVVRLQVHKHSLRRDQRHLKAGYELTLSLRGYFTPYRRSLEDCGDLDLGSSGPLLISETPFLVTGGKEGLVYVLDRTDMGEFARAGPPWDAAGARHMWTSLTHSQVPADDLKRDHAYQKLTVGENTYDPDYSASDLMKWPHIHGTPAFARFEGRHAYMFVWPEKDTIKRYEWDGRHFNRNPLRGKEHAPPNLSDKLNGMPGGMLSVNVDPNGPGLGVVLAALKACVSMKYSEPWDDPNLGYPRCDASQDRGILLAYDPFTLKLVWSNLGESYYFSKFVPPTVAAGRIFLPTASGKVLVYGP